MSTHTLCIIETGAFTDERLSGNLALNPPPAGHCWVPGEHNPNTRRLAGWAVDDFGTQVPVIEPQTPAPPPENEWAGWAWDAAAERWREAPKLKLLQANARPALLQVLVELDGKQARPVGEITEAQALALPIPEQAVARLQAIAADKQAVRARLAAIDAVETIEQLHALLTSPVVLQTSPPDA
jgi:hypothetical protein